MPNVFLNGKMVDASEASISPMDRGFLFGDGIYEVIPTYGGKPVGLSLHLERLQNGLDAIGINYQADLDHINAVITELVQEVEGHSVGIYWHISRGADIKRFHAYPSDITPTVFAYAFKIPDSPAADVDSVKTFKVTVSKDLRWQRCHIKSTSLLGNVMHFQQGQEAGLDETILFNQNNEVTEASACNVFIVKNETVITPPLSHQLLPGVTRNILIQAIETHTNLELVEQTVSVDDLFSADEVWITSSSKEVGPVTYIDEHIIGNGKAGPIWLQAQTAYNQLKFLV